MSIISLIFSAPMIFQPSEAAPAISWRPPGLTGRALGTVRQTTAVGCGWDAAELPGTIQQTFVTLKGMKVLSILRMIRSQQYPTVEQILPESDRVCVVCQREQTRANRSHHIILQELSGSFYSSDWSGEISSFMRCFRRSIPGAVFAAIRIGKVESWMLLQTSSPEALHVSRAALGSSTLCKSKQNPQTSPVRAL